MTELWAYLWGVLSEGVVIGLLFWAILYVTIESTKLSAAIVAGLVSESIGNLPYLFGEAATEPVGLLMTLVAGVIFVRMILRARELSMMKAVYGILTTYFALVAVVACSV